jgi:hypothetical protein
MTQTNLEIAGSPRFFSSLLGRCAEQLRYAVRHLADSSGTPQEKLASMYNETTFGSIYEGDFTAGSLRHDFQAISAQMSRDTEPHFVAHIAAISDDRARRVIAQVCSLSEACVSGEGQQCGQTKRVGQDGRQTLRVFYNSCSR